MGHKQTLILVKIHVEMVENYTLKAKWPILAIVREMTTSGGTNLCVDSIYSSYNTVL